MTVTNAPDEEKKNLRKKQLKKRRKTENWRRKQAGFGPGKVSKQTGHGRMEG